MDLTNVLTGLLQGLAEARGLLLAGEVQQVEERLANSLREYQSVTLAAISDHTLRRLALQVRQELADLSAKLQHAAGFYAGWQQVRSLHLCGYAPQDRVLEAGCSRWAMEG